MSILRGALGAGRRMAESRMTETVKVGVVAMSTHPVTGDPVETWTSTSYDGPGQIVYRTETVSDRAVPGQPAAVQTPVLKLPSGTVVHRGEDVRVTASTVDAPLVGARFVIDGQAQKGQTTAARYPLREVT